MKTITKTIKVYTYDELDSEAQEKAISDEIRFILETENYEDMSQEIKKGINKAEELKTPWFTEGYIYDYAKDQIIETLKVNNYEFLENGSLFIKN